MSNYYAPRLTQTLTAAGVPNDGVSIINESTHVIRIDFQASATQAQRDQAAALVAAFDWSPAADATWLSGIERASALATFLSDHSASAKVLRALAFVLLDQVNALEAQIQTLRNDCRAAAPTIPAVTYPQYTTDDLGGAIQTKLATGVAD